MSNVKSNKGNAKMATGDSKAAAVVGGGDVESANVIKVPLNVIKVDLDWNSRNKLSVLQEGNSGDDQESGKMTTDELSASIEAKGQDTPVHVIPNPDKKDRKFEYVLVAGFKRFEAIRRLSERALHNNNINPIKADPTWSAKYPTIKAAVDNLSPLDALLMNVRENTARANLTMPDTTAAIMRILDAYAAEGKKITETELANDLGLSQGYVNKLKKIGEATRGIKNGEILRHWRESRNPLTMKQMTDCITQSTPDRIFESYQTATSQVKTEKAGPDANAWFEKAAEEATKVGVIIGVLQSLDQIPESVCQEIDWESNIADLIKVKKGADAKDVIQLGRKAHAGYIFGLTKRVVEAAEEAKEKAAKVAAKAEKKNEAADKKGEKKPEAAGNGAEAAPQN